MGAAEIAAFLDDRETGVLSLADGGEAYGIPVSFTYRESERALYFRLGYTPESRKRTFVDATEDASVTVYGETGDEWRSVVVRGPLSEVPESSVDPDVLAALDALDVPFVTMYDRPTKDVRFRITRLDAEELTGCRGGGN